MEKHRATIKFKAAARIARVTHDLTSVVRANGSGSENSEENDYEIMEETV